MLLRLGGGLAFFAVALAVSIVVILVLRGGDTPPEPASGATEPEETRPEAESLPVAARDWPEPTPQQLAVFDAPRVYEPEPGAEMTLTVPAMGLIEAPVVNSDEPDALDRGVIHLPQTPMPWDEAAQKNVYLAGHRLGYPGTGSHLIFYNLDALRPGDAITVKDREGRPYKYEVSQIFVVGPLDTWAAEPVRGRDMLTLQTCTPIPTFENRLVVRADRL